VHYSPSNPEGLAFLTGSERLAEDEVLGEMMGHADEIDELLTTWLSNHTREEIQTLAQEVRVPFTMVQSIDETLNDPQNSYRNFFVDIDHSHAGTLKYPTSPFRLRTTEWMTESPPLLGQHNQEIYMDTLQLTEKEYKNLSENRII
jgi:crotonobetainyl-CoA:carnitine CoA-transferase CaiB-like acyl-CoA transferase